MPSGENDKNHDILFGCDLKPLSLCNVHACISTKSFTSGWCHHTVKLFSAAEFPSSDMDHPMRSDNKEQISNRQELTVTRLIIENDLFRSFVMLALVGIRYPCFTALIRYTCCENKVTGMNVLFYKFLPVFSFPYVSPGHYDSPPEGFDKGILVAQLDYLFILMALNCGIYDAHKQTQKQLKKLYFACHVSSISSFVNGTYLFECLFSSSLRKEYFCYVTSGCTTLVISEPNWVRSVWIYSCLFGWTCDQWIVQLSPITFLRAFIEFD